MNQNTESTINELAHLAFCALVALHLANQEGRSNSPSSENLFLVRWLAQAHKQKRFSRHVAVDIEMLLEKGRRMGVTGKLKQHLEYLWCSCTGGLDKQSDLFRLTYATECLKEKGWDSIVVPSKEWCSEKIFELPPNKSGFFVEKAQLNAGFAVGGKLLQPLPFRVSGDIHLFVEALNQCSLNVKVVASTPAYIQVELLPVLESAS